MLITLYKTGGVHFRLLGMNGFHVKATERMKDLLLRAPVVVRTLNMKISRRRLADYFKTLHQKACRTCSTIIFLHSTNQIIDLWRCRWCCRRQIYKLSILNSTLSWTCQCPASYKRTSHCSLDWLLCKSYATLEALVGSLYFTATLFGGNKGKGGTTLKIIHVKWSSSFQDFGQTYINIERGYS